MNPNIFVPYVVTCKIDKKLLQPEGSKGRYKIVYKGKEYFTDNPNYEFYVSHINTLMEDLDLTQFSEIRIKQGYENTELEIDTETLDFMKTQTEKTNELNQGTLDRSTFRLGMVSMYFYMKNKMKKYGQSL